MKYSFKMIAFLPSFCYDKEELFLFGVKDSISLTFRLDDHFGQG